MFLTVRRSGILNDILVHYCCCFFSANAFTGNVAIEKFEEIIIDFILSRRTVITRKYTEDECLMFGLICVYYSVAVTGNSIVALHVFLIVYCSGRGRKRLCGGDPAKA